MSRCFPYPPPGYCRNGAAHEALIESIKLQKETDKAKAERKKEKKLLKKEKKEKKKLEKEKRKNEEKLKSQTNQSEDAHKLLQKEAGIPEAQNNGKKPITEVLEKSDLTEENGQPIKPCYSSDSTQNSNKRRRDDNDNDNDNENDNDHHGKHIKIRLLKKHKESDPTTSGLPPPRRENNAAQRAPLTQTKSNGLYLGRQQLQQQQRPGPTHLKHDIPSSSASRNIGVQGPNLAKPGPITTGKRPSNETTVSLLNKPSLITTGKRPINESPVPGNISLLNKPNPITTGKGKRPVNEIPVPGNISLLNKPSPITTGKRPVNETQFPGTSGPTNGPTNLGKKKEEPEKAGPSRSRAEKKMMKKHKKYEKLIGSWVPPPVFQALLPQVGDEEDWLSRGAKPVSSTISKGEVETCGVSETGLWQPRARFLAEADIHALPYTVPF